MLSPFAVWSIITIHVEEHFNPTLAISKGLGITGFGLIFRSETSLKSKRDDTTPNFYWFATLY
jgi:hypothetical protein